MRRITDTIPEVLHILNRKAQSLRDHGQDQIISYRIEKICAVITICPVVEIEAIVCNLLSFLNGHLFFIKVRQALLQLHIAARCVPRLIMIHSPERNPVPGISRVKNIRHPGYIFVLKRLSQLFTGLFYICRSVGLLICGHKELRLIPCLPEQFHRYQDGYNQKNRDRDKYRLRSAGEALRKCFCRLLLRLFDIPSDLIQIIPKILLGAFHIDIAAIWTSCAVFFYFGPAVGTDYLSIHDTHNRSGVRRSPSNIHMMIMNIYMLY